MTSWQNIAIPVVLLLTGLILLTGDGIGLLSLDRIQSFWPLALIVVGMLELPSEKKQRN
jgi:hypothetical protein